MAEENSIVNAFTVCTKHSSRNKFKTIKKEDDAGVASMVE